MNSITSQNQKCLPAVPQIRLTFLCEGNIKIVIDFKYDTPEINTNFVMFDQHTQVLFSAIRQIEVLTDGNQHNTIGSFDVERFLLSLKRCQKNLVQFLRDLDRSINLMYVEELRPYFSDVGIAKFYYLQGMDTCGWDDSGPSSSQLTNMNFTMQLAKKTVMAPNGNLLYYFYRK